MSVDPSSLERLIGRRGGLADRTEASLVKALLDECRSEGLRLGEAG